MDTFTRASGDGGVRVPATAAGPVPHRRLPSPFSGTNSAHTAGCLGVRRHHRAGESHRWSWSELMALPAESVTVDVHCVTR